MKTHSKDGKRFKRVFLWALVLFVVIFLLRWAYALFSVERPAGYSYLSFAATSEDSYRMMSGNVASKAYEKETLTQAAVIDQKFEKIANLSAQTTAFDHDNQQIRQAVQIYGAVIQQEAMRGLKNDQTLALVIGVPPEQFDGLVADLRAIGKETSFSTDQVDKTQEYRALLAQRETLQKTQDAYRALKAQGGSLQDQLLLEEKILDTERSLQDLGVNLGIYADESSLCTINVELRENQSAVVTWRAVGATAVSSFFWTLSLYALLILVLLLAFVAALLVAKGMRYVKKLLTAEDTPKENLTDKTDE